ncbi:hypothetical protein IFM60648_04168 [Aspergillus lentulus]|uniref:Mid2 domain-containing protein n=1 Tax=Aspergillus lentulus TaxID=293939 RepID=A0ABQ1A5W1_ASPLE|nr:hypothetical protein IFM60648_04168 [Aspergillus lentulus]
MASPTPTGTPPPLTTLPMTSVFTPPAPCSTYWTYEPFSYNNVYPSGLLMQNCENVVSSCFPSGFANSGRQTATRIYSPGYCPMGYTSADIAIHGPVTTAICCYSDFVYTTSTMIYSDLPPAIYAGCTSPFPSSRSTIVSARAAENNQGTQVHGPIIMWAQPVTVQFQSSDLSLFVTPTTISITSKSGSVPVQTTTTSTALPTANTSQIPSATQTTESNHFISSTGLSAGAKAGIGVGAGVGGVAIFALLFFVFRHLRKARSKSSKGQYYHNTEALGGLVPPAGSRSRQGPPSELDNAESNSRKYLPELQG